MNYDEPSQLMALLADVFKNSHSKVRKTIAAIDIVSSTAMKEKESEASWLNTFAWFYDLTSGVVKEYNGVVVKFLGDGVMVAFSEDDAAAAINCAISLQEQIAEANAARTVALNCCVGIATGDLREFDVSEAGTLKDYLGNVVDKAFRLCGAANAKAILVDKATVEAGRMHKVKCKVGESTAVKRSPEEYLGSLEYIPLKGFSAPVQFHEILWEMNRYGLNPKYPAQAALETPSHVDKRAQTSLETPSSAEHSLGRNRKQWMRGSVSTLNANFGFLHCNGEDFWFNHERLFSRLAIPKVRDAVWFVPRDPMPNAKSRQATSVLPHGATLEGILATVTPKNYGFAYCTNAFGEQESLFVYLTDSAQWAKGMEITFTVGENEKGPAGIEPRAKQVTGGPDNVSPPSSDL